MVVIIYSMFFNEAPNLNVSHLKHTITRDILNHCKISVIAVIRTCCANFTHKTHDISCSLNHHLPSLLICIKYSLHSCIPTKYIFLYISLSRNERESVIFKEES